MTSPVAVAIVGVGHGHSNLYIPALVADPLGRVAAVSEPDPAKRARRAAELGGVPSYEDCDEMFDAHPELDLVYVLGEHCQMAEYAIATARRGIPFVLEKPGGLTLGGLLRVREAVAAAGVPVAVPFVQRIGPLAELFAITGVPEHVSLQFQAGLPRRYRDSGDDWLLDPERAGGGVMLNLGVHFIDAFLHFCAADGAAEVLGALLRSLEPGLEVEDYFCALLGAQSGATGFVEASYSFPSTTERYVSFAVRGNRGFACMDTRGSGYALDAAGKRELALDPDSNNYYAPFVRAVYERLGTGFAGLPTLDDLVRVREVTDSIASAPTPNTSSATR